MAKLFLLAAAFGSMLLLSGCTSSGSDATKVSAETSNAANGKPKIKLQLNWFPEAEHGCFFAAKELGYYDEAGLDVEIIPGGKTTVLAQELTLGRVQFGIGNADDVLVAAQQDAPVVAVMSTMQHTPRCIMVRQETGITRFDQLKDVTLLLDSSRAYVPYLKSLGHLGESVKIAPYFGSIAPLATDVRYGCQGYSFSEPYLAREQGINVNILSVRDVGYDPYCSLLVTTRELIEKDPEMVRKFVAASLRGLRAYIDDPARANAAILSLNSQEMTAGALEFGAKAVGELSTVADGEKLGSMQTERWAALIQQLGEVNFVTPGKLEPDMVFTNEFIP